MVEKDLRKMLNIALKKLDVEQHDIEIEVPKDTTHGDFSTNIAMKLARVLRKSPMQIAEMIVEQFPNNEVFKEITIAKPGFINFVVDKRIYYNVITEINSERELYGSSSIGHGEHYNIEFVSANPTGSLHIGHARGAAAGDSLARILKKAGYRVTKEFYVNDGGNQIHNLALSINARYKALFNEPVEMPEDGYYGKEIIALAKTIQLEHGDRYLKEDGYAFFRQYGVDYLLDQLKTDLRNFGVEFDIWFSEAKLYEEKLVEKTIETLKEKDYTYEKDNALWLKTSEFGDEKDRVIIKSDGSYTYVTPDIAYHKEKLSRGYTKLIDILGGDHHGYVPRLKAAIEMFTGQSDYLEVDLLQMVKVIQNGEEVKMSKRSGKAITLSDLVEDVGKDPIRYFFAMRSLNTHMELDLDLALKQTNENPVFYAQYAHARIASVMRQAAEKGVHVNTLINQFETLDSDKIDTLLTVLVDYKNVVEEAATKRIPHKITQYIHRLAQALHSYYAEEKVITDDERATKERLALIHAVKIVLKDALSLVGVDAKDRM